MGLRLFQASQACSSWSGVRSQGRNCDQSMSSEFIPQRSESSGSITMVPLPSEGGESKVR